MFRHHACHSNLDFINSVVIRNSMYNIYMSNSPLLAWRIPWTEEPGRLQSVESEELDTIKHTQLSSPLERAQNFLFLKNVNL